MKSSTRVGSKSASCRRPCAPGTPTRRAQSAPAWQRRPRAAGSGAATESMPLFTFTVPYIGATTLPWYRSSHLSSRTELPTPAARHVLLHHARRLGCCALGSFHETTVTKVAKQMALADLFHDPLDDFLVKHGIDNFYYAASRTPPTTKSPRTSRSRTAPTPHQRAVVRRPRQPRVRLRRRRADRALEYVAPKWVMDDRYFTRRVSLGGGAAPGRCC